MLNSPHAGSPAGRRAVARIEDLLSAGLTTLPQKPPDNATRAAKKLMSAAIAIAFGSSPAWATRGT